MRVIFAAILFVSLLIQPVFTVDTYAYLDNTSQYIHQLITLINHYRESNHLKPLSLDGKLTILAQNHSADMQRRGALSHDRFEARFKHSGTTSAWRMLPGTTGPQENCLQPGRIQEVTTRICLPVISNGLESPRVGTYVTFFACN